MLFVQKRGLAHLYFYMKINQFNIFFYMKMNQFDHITLDKFQRFYSLRSAFPNGSVFLWSVFSQAQGLDMGLVSRRYFEVVGDKVLSFRFL